MATPLGGFSFSPDPAFNITTARLPAAATPTAAPAPDLSQFNIPPSSFGFGGIGGFGNLNPQTLAALAAQFQGQTPQAPSTVRTALGGVEFGGVGTDVGLGGVEDIDALIKARTPEALGLIRQGSAEQLRLAERAAGAQAGPLEQFGGLEAFRERSAILGLRGTTAQEQAIGNIPVSEFNRELNRRQRATQARTAFARGDVSGASLLGAQNLAAGQQADIIQGRLGELDPLIAASRGVRSTLSGIDEATRARQAQILSGRGTQLADIRIGATAPLIEGTLQRAELSGLQGISAANQKAQIQNQLAALAGKFAPQIGSFFSQPQTQPITGFQAQIPEAGFSAIA